MNASSGPIPASLQSEVIGGPPLPPMKEDLLPLKEELPLPPMKEEPPLQNVLPPIPSPPRRSPHRPSTRRPSASRRPSAPRRPVSTRRTIRPSPPSNTRNTGPPASESVDVFTAPLSDAIRQQILPQSKEGTKYNHFQFENTVAAEAKLRKAIERAIGSCTVEFHYNVKKHPDVLITRPGRGIVGKVHFLHFNRPDMCDSTKWFVKLYFYEFGSQKDYDAVRGAMVDAIKSMIHSSSMGQRLPTLEGGRKQKPKSRKLKAAMQKPKSRKTQKRRSA